MLLMSLYIERLFLRTQYGAGLLWLWYVLDLKSTISWINWRVLHFVLFTAMRKLNYLYNVRTGDNIDLVLSIIPHGSRTSGQNKNKLIGVAFRIRLCVFSPWSQITWDHIRVREFIKYSLDLFTHFIKKYNIFIKRKKDNEKHVNVSNGNYIICIIWLWKVE